MRETGTFTLWFKSGGKEGPIIAFDSVSCSVSCSLDLEVAKLMLDSSFLCRWGGRAGPIKLDIFVID
jgi:hypothetical protein